MVNIPTEAELEAAKARREQQSGSKCWVFTCFDAQAPVFDPNTMDFISYQQERCPHTGKLHWQGYLEIPRKLVLKSVKKIIGNSVHLQIRRGTQEEAIAYTMKDESAIAGTRRQYGTKHAPDAPSQYKDCIADVKKGKQLMELAVNHTAVMCRNFSGIQRTVNLLNLAREQDDYKDGKIKFRQLKVSVFWGDNGTGKSAMALREALIYANGEPPYFKTSPDIYFDNLNDGVWSGRRKCVILNDFYGGIIKLAQFLNFLDGYNSQLPVKGTFTPVYFEHVWITSNRHPSTWYTGEHISHESILGMYRRFTTILHFINPELEAARRANFPNCPTEFVEIFTPIVNEHCREQHVVVTKEQVHRRVRRKWNKPLDGEDDDDNGPPPPGVPLSPEPSALVASPVQQRQQSSARVSRAGVRHARSQSPPPRPLFNSHSTANWMAFDEVDTTWEKMMRDGVV